MSKVRGLARRIRRKLQGFVRSGPDKQSELTAAGWDHYGRRWEPDRFEVIEGQEVRHLGDEWTVEKDSGEWSTYGLPNEVLAGFDAYLEEKLLPHLPAGAKEGLEIGPGGGRLTALLLPRTGVLHLAEPAASMIGHLKRRFPGEEKLRYHHTDGKNLPALPFGSLDYAIAFDVFVHMEPRLIYWYLRQIRPLLRPGGIGIMHHGDVLTERGFKQFLLDLDSNLEHRVAHDAFGVMCPPIMEKFLRHLDFEILSLDIGLIPRDAVAVFRKPA